MDKESGNARRETPCIAFAGFVLDTDRGVLSGDGKEVTLRPKSLAVLCVLLDHAGRLVTKEQLLEAVWPGAVVSDDTVTQSIGDIRRALGGEGASLLQTLPRRGYLMDIPAVKVATSAPEPDSGEVPPNRWLRVGMVGGLFLLASLTLSLSWDREPIIGDPVASVSTDFVRPIVVVPEFIDETGDDQLSQVASGLWRDVVEALKLSVVAIALEPETIIGWDGAPTVAAIAERTGGDFVLSGKLISQGSILRFSFALFDAQKREVVWQQDISQASLDALAIRQELIKSLDEALASLVADEGAIAGDLSSEAYEYYLRGKILLDGMSTDDEDAAHYQLKQVTQLAPGFAPGWREMARVQHRFINRRDTKATTGDVRLLYSLLQRADRLGTDAATKAYLAWHEIDFNGSFANGFERLAEATQLNPYDEDVLRVAMHTAYASGDKKSAARLAKYALRFNPLCKACLYHEMQAQLALRNYEDALLAFEQFSVLFPGGETTKARIHLLSGDPVTALDVIENEIWVPGRLSTKVMILDALGRRDESAALLDQLLATEPQDYYLLSRVYAYLGDSDKAFATLELLATNLRSVRDGEVIRWNNVFLGGWLQNPEFFELRADPRWAAFVNRYQLRAPDGVVADIVDSLPSNERMNSK